MMELLDLVPLSDSDVIFKLSEPSTSDGTGPN